MSKDTFCLFETYFYYFETMVLDFFYLCTIELFEENITLAFTFSRN